MNIPMFVTVPRATKESSLATLSNGYYSHTHSMSEITFVDEVIVIRQIRTAAMRAPLHNHEF